MLLALIICQLSVLAAANPFHKYPFVFLLDVGNEELDKTNTEQIRISTPGGSVALRYPAIGDGDTIGHIRVSGIDFGTDLKANIVDGGPGYKYVVLVFMGNPGVPYDAVVTVQTVSDQTFDTPNIENDTNSEGNADQVEEDANNSAEDLSDDPVVSDHQSKTYIQSSNAELMQSSSNVYNYAHNEVMDDGDYADGQDSNTVNNSNDNPSDELDVNENDDNYQESESSIDETENISDQKDIHEQYSDEVDKIDDSNVQEGIDDINDNDEETRPKLDQYAEDADENERISINDGNIYSKYEDLKPRFNGEELYYQNDEPKINRPDYQQEPLDYDDPDEPILNDGEIRNDADIYKDSNNNNYIDSDDSYAVAY